MKMKTQGVKFPAALLPVLLLLGATFSLPQSLVQAQELERDLQFRPVVNQAAHQVFDEAARGGGQLSLPFFDDFASPTYAIDAPTPELVRWVDASARRTTTIAINPPTVGCATLDGLDAGGYPYYFQADASGWADTLTSRAIDLSSELPDDNVHLVFQFQGGGRGNAPDENDSLVVEFLAPAGGVNGWSQVWSTTGAAMDTFALAFIPVTDLSHLQSGFQFRFRNHGSQAGHTDLWHVDYVFLDDNVSPDNFNFFEVAFTESEHTLLETYHAMPWTHYLTNPDGFMADSVSTSHRNLSSLQADNVTAGIVVRDVETDATETMENPFSITVVSPQAPFSVPYYIQEGNATIDPNGFAFSAAGNDTCAAFDVSFYQDNIGILFQDRIGVPNNDSIVFTQEFDNYYAYDDGTAEKAYGLTAAGGKLAVRYDLAMADTLHGLAIHFTPYYDAMHNNNFLLRVWEDLGGMPGEEMGDNYLFHYPTYFTEGGDLFAYYAFDQPMEVEGTIHVGMVQEAEFSLNIGLDKNTDFNNSRVHYMLGLGADWVGSTIEGTVMIRPVLKAGKSEVWTGIADLEPATNAAEASAVPSWTIAPNPARTQITVLAQPSNVASQLSLFDISGRLVRSLETAAGRSPLPMQIGDLPRGLYTLQLQLGASTSSKRVILQ
jgi:hypothetical protein